LLGLKRFGVQNRQFGRGWREQKGIVNGERGRDIKFMTQVRKNTKLTDLGGEGENEVGSLKGSWRKKEREKILIK